MDSRVPSDSVGVLGRFEKTEPILALKFKIDKSMFREI